MSVKGGARSRTTERITDPDKKQELAYEPTEKSAKVTQVRMAMTRIHVICISVEPEVDDTVAHGVLSVNWTRNFALEISPSSTRRRFASIGESYNVNFVFESGIIAMLTSYKASKGAIAK